MNEKAVPFRIVEPGSVITQGRGGQAIIQDTLGNIFLTTSNITGSDQTKLSVKDSISSITILGGETSSIIETRSTFSSNNFNTINYNQSTVGAVQVVQPIRKQTTSSLNLAIDIPVTSSRPTITSSRQQITQSIEEQLLFLPASEDLTFTQITDLTIEGTKLDEFKFLPEGEETVLFMSSGSVKTYGDCSTKYPEFNFTENISPTYLSYSDAKRYLKSKYSDSIAKAVYAIIWAESSKTKSQFRSPGGYNYSGVQTDNSRWSASGIIGQFCTRDQVRFRAFAIFESNDKFLDFMANRVKSKNFDGNNSTNWARTYLNSWVFFNLEGRDKKLFDSTLPSKIAIYKTAIKNFES